MPDNKTSYDVLLLTATKDERDAILESQSDWQEARDNKDFPYHYRTDDIGFQWALARASDMGVEYAANLTTRLASELSPRCIAMVGVCAGDNAKVSLGDVIVADRLYRYDSGKLRATINGADISEELLLDIRTYNLNEHWRRELEDHDFGPWSESLVNSRPRSLEHQRYWLLSKLLEHHDGRSPHPRELSERDTHCPDWSIVFDQLNDAGQVVNDRGMQITELGRRELVTYHNRYPGGLPAEKPAPTVLVGTMATGSKVVEDERLFPTLQKVVRKTIAVDMEASAIAAVAELERGLPFLVIKGVQDYATPKKDDRFRKYAAEASFRFAETALRHLLREPRTPLGKVSAHSFTFTNVDQVLSRIYRVRRVVISNEESLDFSDRSKVKFELWEVKIARTEHILVLGEDVVLGQTIDRFLEMTQQKGINIEDLTIIQVKQRARGSTPKQISDRLKGIRHRFFPIRDYIRQFCLPAELSRQEAAFEEPFYIDQPMYDREIGGQALSVDGGHSGTPADEDAIRVLKSRITSLNSSCAHMIFANGGDGKSSLCAKLVNAINSDPTYDRLAILLRVEDISEKLVRESEGAKRIDTVFDVYNLFAVHSGRVPQLNEDDFDVSVLSGNLVLVVDGLDELYTLLHETFDRRSFLQSLSALNSQLGEASVVLTSRANIFEDLEEHFADISISFLLGFNEGRCKKYFEKRFRGRQDGFDLEGECMRDVRRLLEISDSERISPYIVDLIAKLHVDERDIGANRMGDRGKLQWMGPRDLYPNNGGLTDKVVFHVLNREIVRQSTELSVTDMIDLFCEIAAEHGTSISLVKLRETVTEYYDRKADSVFEVLRLNPLIRIQNDVMRFRYHFLYSYFLTLFSLASLYKTAAVASPPISSTFAKLAEGEGAIYRDVLHYVKCQKL